jgi:hypothetical protein
MSTLTVPFWFKQRQAKADPVGEGAGNGDELYRVTAPNMAEAFLGIRKGDNRRWQGFIKQKADGPDLQATAAEFETPGAAREAAFELFRQRFVV